MWVGIRSGLALALLIVLAGCQAADRAPIVHVAPPDTVARASAAPASSGPSPAPSGAVSGAVPSTPVAFTIPTPLPTAAPAATAPDASVAPSAGASAAGDVVQVARGEILFGTAPGATPCTIVNPSPVLRASQPLYFAGLLNERMDGSQSIVLHIERNGTTLVDHAEPANGSAFDCYANSEPIGTFQPGTYLFQVLRGTTLEADGTVTVE